MARPLKIDDLVVWKLACEFEDGVLALLDGSPRAVRSLAEAQRRLHGGVVFF
jgi:hypothetical protein